MARPDNPGAIAGHVQGLREAKAAFQALPEIVRDAMLAATELTVSEIARHAKARIQSSPSIQTRSLLNAIAWRVTRSNGRGRVGVTNATTAIAGTGGSALKRTGARLIRPARYAHLVEFGTRDSAAEPFMVPAAESQKQPYLERCKHAGKVIEQKSAVIGMRHL